MLKSAYVGAMRTLAAPLRAAGVLPSFERAPRRSLRFWIASQFAIHDPAALVRLDAPWWTLSAIDAVETWIAKRGNVRAFEYGSGASTVWLARRCRDVVTVEHDAGFAKYVAPLLARDNIRVNVIEPERGVAAPKTPSGRAGFADCDFSAYVDAIAAGGPWDLVVIDGRARAACLERARGFLAPGALVVFDNSNRERYRDALSRTPEVRYRGWAAALPYPSQTSLIEFGGAT
ncbi:MAG: class I SAM-dependent methyltransferase [Rhodanobacteraceae bacterium]